MSVLTLAGKPINWAKPPSPTTKCLWSQRTTGGKRVTGSFRTIAALDHINALAKKKFGQGIVVYQPPYNTGVRLSKGTHDQDAVLDVWIPGVSGGTQQSFFRANGWGAYHRTPAQGFDEHEHMFLLPEKIGSNVSRRWQLQKFKVGYLVDGGWSTRGKVVASSQIADYYAHKDALKDHRHDPSWFPPDIDATIFDLDAYVRKQQDAMGPSITVATNNIMSLPKNEDVEETLAATPTASVIGVQECDIFHKAVRRVKGYDCPPIPDSDHYDSVVLFKPAVWELLGYSYELLYEGSGGISKTRHAAIVRLRHKETRQQVIFVAAHDVTRGEDSIRKGLRRKSRKVIRGIVKRHQKLGQPVFVLADMNTNASVFRTALVIAKHGIDHIYAWAGKGVTWVLLATHAVKTPSDHDAWIARLLMKWIK